MYRGLPVERVMEENCVLSAETGSTSSFAVFVDIGSKNRVYARWQHHSLGIYIRTVVHVALTKRWSELYVGSGDYRITGKYSSWRQSRSSLVLFDWDLAL